MELKEIALEVAKTLEDEIHSLDYEDCVIAICTRFLARVDHGA